MRRSPRIVGGDDKNLITLEEVQGIGRGAEGLGPRTARYEAQVALEGKRFAEGEGVVFDEISIHASDLNAWTQVSGFKTVLETESLDERDRVVATEVRYEAPEDIRIPLPQGEEILISFICMGKGLGGGSDRIELRQESSLRWRFAHPLGVFEVFERVGQIRNFLSLAVGRPVSITSVTGFQGSYTHHGTDLPRPIELHWGIPHNPEPPKDFGHPAHMLFTLADADPDPSALLQRWIERQDRLEPVFNLYFGALYDPDPYLEVKFLAFAQALETYDIRRRGQPKRVSLAARTVMCSRSMRGSQGRSSEMTSRLSLSTSGTPATTTPITIPALRRRRRKEDPSCFSPLNCRRSWRCPCWASWDFQAKRSRRSWMGAFALRK